MVTKICAWCGKRMPGSQRHIRRRTIGPWSIYFYRCRICGRWTGIDYKLDVKAKMNSEDVYGSH